MKKLLLLAFFGTLSFAAQAAEIAYVPLDMCDIKPYASQRDYWDQTGKFCANGGTWDYTAMPEIKLRQKGRWVPSGYVEALSAANRAIVEQYDTYYVRYFAARPERDGKVGFVVHVYYSWGLGTQTIFVFGEFSKEGEIKLTGYSNSSGTEGNLRAAWNTAKNLLAVANAENPNRAGVNQTNAEDRERIQPVTDVLNKYGRVQTDLIKIKPLN